MVGHHLHPEAGGSLRHGGELDQVGQQPHLRQATADQPRQSLGAHLDADDRRRLAVIVEAGVGQRLAQLQHVAHHRLAARVPFLGFENLERLQHGRRLHRRQRVGEGGGRAVEAQIFLHRAAPAGHEAAIGGERLGEAAHHDIDLAEHVLQADMAATVFAEATHVVRDIDHQRGIVFVADLLQADQVGRVGVHREQALGHHQDAVLGVLGADLRQQPPAVVVIEVAELIDVVRGRVGAFLQARMRQHIHHDVIGRADQSLDDAEAGGPPGREQHDFLHLQEVGDPALQRHRIGRIADQRRRARAVHPATLDHFDRGRLDRRMRRHAEIVLRGEIHAAHLDATVVLGLADRAGAIFRCPRERPDAGLAAQVLPPEKALGTLKEVGPSWDPEVPHAALQGLIRNEAIACVRHRLSCRTLFCLGFCVLERLWRRQLNIRSGTGAARPQIEANPDRSAYVVTNICSHSERE